MKAITTQYDEDILVVENKHVLFNNSVEEDDILLFFLSVIDKMNLNEPHSCDIAIEDNIIQIIGDEDYMLLKIINVEPIKT